MDPKQQIVDKVKQATNILVTVSNDPSVDQLAACIGLTLMLNKMDKHGIAVFSGRVPSTIEFLQPEKTLETNTDSLRDFIISLDKSKADKLRYKVEDQVVRIFITPYRTSISEKDLVFTQGDFNVEVVIALGVHKKEQIDAAITSHGKILHDATIVVVNSGEGPTLDLGQINWQDQQASSLCEMLVSISEAFGSGLIDNQIATSFLTGIVAATERFSNTKTSPRIMTMSAQLMAAGANQQLIASKLAAPKPAMPTPIPWQPSKPSETDKSPSTPAVWQSKSAESSIPTPINPPTPPPSGGELNIHGGGGASTGSEEVEINPDEIQIDEEGNIKTAQDMQFTSESTHLSPATPALTESKPAHTPMSPPTPPLPPKAPEAPAPPTVSSSLQQPERAQPPQTQPSPAAPPITPATPPPDLPPAPKPEDLITPKTPPTEQKKTEKIVPPVKSPPAIQHHPDSVHSFLGTNRQPMTYSGGTFSAGMYPDNFTSSVDPLGSSQGDNPAPSASPSPGVEGARSAVENALATGNNQTNQGVPSALSSLPPGPELPAAPLPITPDTSTPATDSFNPVLPIPITPQPANIQPTQSSQPIAPSPTSPPPLPPPLMPTPGLVVPTQPSTGLGGPTPPIT